MFAGSTLAKRFFFVLVLLLLVYTKFIYTRTISFGKIAFESSCERKTWISANETCAEKGGVLYSVSDLKHRYGGYVNKLAIEEHATIWLDKKIQENETEACPVLSKEHIRIDNSCEEKHYFVCRVTSDADFIFNGKIADVPYQGCNSGTTKEPFSEIILQNIPTTRPPSSYLSYTHRTILIFVVCFLVIAAGVVAVCYFNRIGKKIGMSRKRRRHRRHRCSRC
ncbi:uncharacterized protein LOC124271497 [Haliotis rubra]|uniref:uncharacterized protein LOC124271497 n=1 Tax=Haliotis rubra TaxID=36100 RepID=UPI001EE5FCF4|nr:uncharacterized protein LOC124271497 [Haliotis rubra]